MDSPGSYESYQEFLISIIRSMKRHHNSVVPVEQVMTHQKWMSESDWETRRRNYRAVELAIEEINYQEKSS